MVDGVAGTGRSAAAKSQLTVIAMGKKVSLKISFFAASKDHRGTAP